MNSFLIRLFKKQYKIHLFLEYVSQADFSVNQPDQHRQKGRRWWSPACKTEKADTDQHTLSHSFTFTYSKWTQQTLNTKQTWLIGLCTWCQKPCRAGSPQRSRGWHWARSTRHRAAWTLQCSGSGPGTVRRRKTHHCDFCLSLHLL